MGEENKQDITSVIEEGAQVTQVGKVEKKEIHIHIYSDSPKKTKNEITKKVYLIYVDKDGREKEIELKNKIIIYRAEKGWGIFAKGDENKSLNVMDGSISRNGHAIFYIEDEKIYIQDLESKNGTFVNGEKIKKKRIYEGDLIKVGSNLIFRLEYDPNKITAKKFYPIPISKEMAKKCSSKNIVETEKGYFLIPSEEMDKVSNKQVVVKKMEEKKSLENLKQLIMDDNPKELINSVINSMIKETEGNTLQSLKKIKKEFMEKDTKNEIIKLLGRIIKDL